MTTDAGRLERRADASGAASLARVRVLEVLARAERAGTCVGVVHLDIDRFHRVNATFGQVAGDEVLATLHERLVRVLPADSLVVAGDGDAFVAVLPASDVGVVRAWAATLLDAVRLPISVGGSSLGVQASAGIAWRAPGDSPADLVEHAFLACRRAKATAPGSVVTYEVSLAAEAERRQRIEDGLRRAIAEDQLVLHVQPEVRAADGTVIGVEALVRWAHPTEGLLGPAAFLPDAEATGLMVAIGDWVLDHAIELASRWCTATDGAPIRVWVNLAAQQLDDGERLCERMRRALDDGAVTAACLGFEVTESSLLADLPSAVGVLMSLRGMGFEIALDDFGTGYSSLTYLRQLPVTVVKIDRQFVAGIRSGSLADEAIVEAVIDLSHALGLSVVAEGVEDADQAERLVALGADSFQGFHFSRPVPPEELDRIGRLRWCGAAPPGGSGRPSGAAGSEGVAGAESTEHHPASSTFVPQASARSRLLLAALDAASDSIVVTSAGPSGPVDQRIVYVNAAFEAESGYAAAEVIGRSVDVLFADPSDPELLAWFEDVEARPESATFEAASRRADGSVFLCETTVSPVWDERGFHTNWLHVRRDLTQRRVAEGDRARFQGLIEQTSSLVFLSETGGRWVYANRAMRRAFGLPDEGSLDGVTNENTMPQGVRDRLASEVVPALSEHGSWVGELRFVHATTGEPIEVECNVEMIADPLRPGTSVFAAVSKDVTATKRLERADARRRELDRFSADFARDALNQDPEDFHATVAGRLGTLAELLRADLAYLDAIDAEAGVLRPMSEWRRIPIPPSLASPTEVDLARVAAWIAELERTDVVTATACANDGSSEWRAELASVFPEPPLSHNVYASLRIDGELLGVLGFASHDATGSWGEHELAVVRSIADTLANQILRGRVTAALRSSEARQSALLANVVDVLAVIDRDGVVRYVNSAIETRYGYRVEDIVGGHFLTVVHPDDQVRAVESFAATITEGQAPPVTEVRIVRADGSWVWCDVEASPTFDPLIGGHMVSLRDVTAQRFALETSERRAVHESFVLELSRWAIEVESAHMLDGLHVHLERLGRMLAADSAFAALIEGDRCRNVAGWSITDKPDDYAFPAGELEVPAVVARYRTLEPLVVSDIMLHDEPWAIEWRAFPVPDRSGLNVPLVSEGRCLGNLGVAMIDTARQWTEEEIAFVQRVAAIVSTLLARLRVEDSLRRSEARLNALLDGSHDLVVVVDRAGVITYANRAVQRALKYPMEQVIGMRIADIMDPADVAMARDQLEMRRDDGTGTITVRLVGADGAAGWWEITSGKMRDPLAGGRVFTCRDVNARVEADAESAAWIELLGTAFDLAQRALDVDPQVFLAELPAVCQRIGELVGADVTYVDRVDEIERSLTNVAGWSRHEGRLVIGPGHSLSFDALPAWIERLRRPEPVVMDEARGRGEPHAIAKREALGGTSTEIAVSMSAAGELFGVLGVAIEHHPRTWSEHEVTFVRIVAETIAHVLERARLDEALRASEARFRLLSENAADVVLLVDGRGRITYASPSSLELLGYTPAELCRMGVLELINPEDARDNDLRRERLLASGQSTSEMRLVRADGSDVWVVNSASRMVDPATGAAEYRISLRDITERKRLEQQLEWQAMHDPLTGLANRMMLRRRIDLAVARRGRPNHVAVLLVDLDGFKAVNDTHGHAIGDQVLCALARRLDTLTRPTDTLARTGGDEFVLLCPETDADGGLALAHRIVEAARQPISIDGLTVTLGASVGVAHRSDGVSDPDALLLDADHAMYAAKRAGRSTARLADVVA